MFNSNWNTLEVAMNVAMLRQEVYTQNLANIETPGYKRNYVEFEELLQEPEMKLKLKTTEKKHISSGPVSFSPIVKSEDSTSLTNDKNNVDADYETVEMLKNTYRYQTLAYLMNSNIQRYNTVIRGVK